MKPGRVSPLSSVALLVVLGLLASTPAPGQTILYEQPPNPFGGANSDGQSITVADDFRLSSAASLEQIVWWGGYGSAHLPRPDGDAFTLRIFTDAGGRPGDLIVTYTFGTEARRTQVSPTDFEYGFILPSPLALEANRTYWLSLANVPTSLSWTWMSSSFEQETCTPSTPCSRRSFVSPTLGPWEDAIDNEAFRLLGTAVACTEVAIDLRIEPEVINLRGGGRWVSAFLAPPAPYSADQIDVSSVQLYTGRGTIVPDPEAPGEIGDDDGNGVADLMLKFKRSDVVGILEGDPTTLVVVGEFLQPTSTCFRGSDEVRVVHVDAPAAGTALAVGQTTAIRWEPADDLPPHGVDLLISRDDGDTWTLDTAGLADDGHHAWTAHGADGDRIRIAVVMVRNAGGGQDVRIGVSERFSILVPTGIDDPPQSLARFALEAPQPNPAHAGAELSVVFHLTDSRPATLLLHDVAGRRMAMREVGALGAGKHTVFLATGRLRAGVYLVRLARAGESRENRVVLIP